jgi:hypothetical protein
MERAKNFCRNADASFAVRMLALFLAVFLGAGWFTPVTAHAQTARDWNQAVCHVFGNCSPVHASWSYHASHIYRAPTRAALRTMGRSVIPVARPNYLRLAFAPTPAFSMQSQRPLTITNDTFTNGAGSGLWSNASNWSAGLPTSSNNVLITGTGSAASVTEDVTATINNLTLNAANNWTLNNALSLTIDGTSISNAGKMTLNSTGSSTELIIGSSAVTLSGGGTLTLSNSADNFIFASTFGNTLVNQETIQGAGNIGLGDMGLVNSGTINANGSAGLVIQTTGVTTNTGTIEATAGSLTLSSMTLNNTGGKITDSGQVLEFSNSTINGGTITLTGAADLQLNAATVEGGTLTNSTTGTIEALSFTNDTLGGTITNPAGGLVKIDNGAVLNLQGGTYTGLGAVSLNSTGNATELVVEGGNVTLSGGSLTLSNNAANFIFGSVGTDTLTNKETISGAGNIGDGDLTLVNSGTINANQSAGLTIQTSGPMTNSGTIEATAGSLTFTNTTVNNTGGKITDSGQNLELTSSTINGGTVTLTGTADLQLNNGTVQAGTLTNSTTGTIEALSFTTDTLGGTITNPTGGVVKVDNGAVLNLQAANYTGLGAVTLNSTGNATELVIKGGNATLSGGSVTLSNNVNNFIFGSVGTDTLTNQETISGAGNIGDGSLTLVNSGTINANQSGGMTIQTSGPTTNSGTIEATGGAVTFTNTTVNNTGGTISATGQNLELTNSTVNGGTITLTGTSDLQLNGGTVQAGTLTNSATGTIEALSFTTDTLGGTITNPAGGQVKIDNGAVLNLQAGNYTGLGAVTLNSTGNATELVIKGGNATLSGGSLTLSNNANNFIFGSVVTDTLTNQETISGAGSIGNGNLTLVNSGTINANQSAGLTIQTNGGTTNTGTIEATAGTVTFTNTTVNNTGGTISATGENLELTNSTVNGGTITLTGTSDLQLNGGTVQAGTLTNSATGTIEALSFTNDTLGGTITNPTGGVVKIDNGATLNLQTGTYSKLGAITLNSTGNFTELALKGGPVTLSGGSVTMSNSADNFILGSGTTNVLTNQETIQGAGNIGNNSMGLINSGTIIANQGTPLIIQPNSMGFSNTGTLQVSTGDVMHVETGPFTNFLGGTLTGGTYNVSGTLEIDELGTAGGEITTNAANIIMNGTGASFVDAGLKSVLTNLNTNATGSSFTIEGGSNFTTVGDFTNNGTLTVGGGTTFNVNGNLTNITGTTLSGGTYNLTGILKANNASGITTNSATITLTGSGALENQSGANALAGLATNSSGASFTINGGANFTTVGNFTNNGTLGVGSSTSKFTVNGNLTNFSGTTLTGGTYNLTGALQFNGANIKTNAANITMTGASAKIIDQSSNNGLANFATNSATGSFTTASGFTLTTAGSFTNAGTLTIGTGSTFTVGGTGSLTQTGGTTTDNGTLSVGSLFGLNGGSVFGSGTIKGNVTNAALITPGTATTTAILADTGAYTQNSTGALDISIAGTTAGTKYDQLNISSTAALNGTLNVSLLNGFIPTVGSTFDILNYTSETGTFSTINGLSINSSEHFTLTVNSTGDAVLTVVSGPLAASSHHLGLRPVSVLAGNRLVGTRIPGVLNRFTFGNLPESTSLQASAPVMVAHPSVPRMSAQASVPLMIAQPSVPRAISGVASPLSLTGLHFQSPLAVATPGATFAGRITGNALVTTSALTMPSASSILGSRFMAAASASGVRAVSGMASHPLLGSSTIHAAAPMLTATTPIYYGKRAGTTLWHPSSGFGKSTVHSGGSAPIYSKLGRRAVVGGFAVPLSNPLSKPKMGFTVQ